MNNNHCVGKRDQFICRSCSFISFLVLIWLTNHDVTAKTQQNTDVIILLICVAFVAINADQWRWLRSLLPACTFGCPLRLLDGNQTCARRRNEGCWRLVFEVASSFGDRSLVACWWWWLMVSDGSFWVIVEMKTSKEVVWIFPKVSTSRSLLTPT